jgi:hypothetical protein
MSLNRHLFTASLLNCFRPFPGQMNVDFLEQTWKLHPNCAISACDLPIFVSSKWKITHVNDLFSISQACCWFPLMFTAWLQTV